MARAQQPGTDTGKTNTTRYPVKPIRFVVGLAPGGATDIVARQIGQKLSEALGQQVIVDNRSGAAGSIAGAIVAKAQADGYTLLFVSSSFAINPNLHALPFDAIKDFAPVIRVAQAPFLLIVSPSLRIESVKELIALGKTKSGKLLFSSGGTGGSGHMAGELFKNLTDIAAEHVPYRGGSPSTLDVASGQVQFTFSAIMAGIVHWKAGRVRAIGVTSLQRSKVVPELPTIAEAGVPGYQALTWYGLLAPAGTPRDVIGKLNETVQKIVRVPDTAEKLLADGAEPVGDSPVEFAKFVAEEIERFGKLARSMGLKPQKL